MENTYAEVIAKPSADITASVLLSNLFEALHNEFAVHKLSTVGLSFPKATPGCGLGDSLRLHGVEADLKLLMQTKFLQRTSDYFYVQHNRPVPENHQLRVVRRIQPKLSASKLRRLLARGSITEDRARELEESRTLLSASYVQIRSHSTNQRFRLFFEQVPLSETLPEPMKFNSYGFGGEIPWF